MQATIYKSTGSWYQAKAENQTFYNTRIKGKFKINGITSTNPVAVGDLVEIDIEDEEQKTAIVTKILDRQNYIVRSSPHNRNQRHIVASNLDQVFLFASLRDPKTSLGFIDRFLVSAEAWHVKCSLIFNKTDLYTEHDWKILEQIKVVYQPLGYEVFELSLEADKGLDKLKNAFQGKTTLVSGQSGVGKSTFINAILPEENIRTQEVSDWSGKGMHTTTFAQMYDINAESRLIDTPGIREFGITNDISSQELSHYFPEMRERLQDCKFNNCLHINEPGCAIKDAVENSEIALDRYLSYCNILETLPKNTY
ncbi:ribosome small subunit-dependent GTPase A [Rhizosphaericola mali]|uniref:Small ribosomal subunit biogenesis GTPase RsgA n=1 Tax=Rhizosphaericola mali TaxID=2545455 RepID=A0A5P2G3U5_9BACT|nr:ribosome small subunit-dependent GTPase A [Rhizosphaericola mali]QES90155.1 ribosome small subunit-dependent GTPase A [Rhizosphaericola mali]